MRGVDILFQGYSVVTHPLCVELCYVPMLKEGHTQQPKYAE